MTVITLSTLAAALGSPGTVAVDGTFMATPWAGSHAVVRVDGADVIVPDTVRVRLADGEPSEPIDLEPNGGEFCWKIVVSTPRPTARLTRFVTVPDSGPVEFGDLVDVDPSTFLPTGEVVAAWEAAVSSMAGTYVTFKNFDGTPVVGKNVVVTLTSDGDDISDITVEDL